MSCIHRLLHAAELYNNIINEAHIVETALEATVIEMYIMSSYAQTLLQV